MVSLLGDTIWALQKDALPLTGISDRLKSFINRVQSGFPGIEFDVEEDISNDIVLSPAAAFDLFRIIQESINNGLKHSGASTIIININSHKSWTIIITDNGKGISVKDKREGNGLHNIRTRAAAHNWAVSWDQPLAGGTAVTIQPQKH
jgi:signal transduction histidine kinase